MTATPTAWHRSPCRYEIGDELRGRENDMSKSKLLISVGAALASVGLVLSASSAAWAGDWAWGAKNCAPSGQYVYTKSGGTGQVTHNHYISGVRNYQTFDNGSATLTRTKTFYSGMTTDASVSGAGTTYASYYCG